MVQKMSISSLILLITLGFILVTGSTPKAEELVDELLFLQSQSHSGVIHLDDHNISRFLTSTKAPRPYSLLIFFDSKKLHDKPKLRLRDIHREFSLLASSFITNNADESSASYGKIFFCDIEFNESRSTFSLFGVNSSPHIRLIDPNLENLEDSEAVALGRLSGIAESMSDFVESRTKLSVGPIHRPPILSRNQLALIIIILLIWSPFMTKKLLSGKTMLHEPKMWLAGAIFVYFFTVSGTMHTIIRKTPMFLTDRNNSKKLVFFDREEYTQLGIEGLVIGFLYIIVGLLMALVTHVVVRVKNVTEQRSIMVVAMVASFWAVYKVMMLDNWKSWYGSHTFWSLWPSSW